MTQQQEQPARFGHGVKQRDLIKMTPEEVDAFLAEGKTMSCATINHDGTIHMVAMWYGFLEGCIGLETKAKSQKVQNLRRDPRVTIEVISREDPYDYVTVSGRVELEEGEEADRHIDKLSEKYTGNPKFQSHRAGERRVIVRVTLERIA